MTCSLTGDGVRLADGRALPWSDLFHIEWTADSAVLASAAGMLEVDRKTAVVVEQQLAPWEPQRDAWLDAVSPAERAGWAELAPGERLELPSTWPRTLLGAFGCVAAVALFARGYDPDSVPDMVVLRLLLVGLVWAGLLMRERHAPRLTLDADGLTCGRRRVLWRDLRAVYPWHGVWGEPRLVLLTRWGRLTLKGYRRERPRVVAALRRALAARETGVPAPPTAGLYAPAPGSPRQGGLWLDARGLWSVERERAQHWDWVPPLGTPPTVREPTHGLSLWCGGLGGDALAVAIDERLYGAPPPLGPAGELSPEAIEAWLGVPPGGARGEQRQRSDLGFLTLLLALPLLWLLRHGTWHLLGGLLCLGGLALQLVATYGSARAVVADAQGLSVQVGRRRRCYAWAELVALEEGAHEWTLVLRDGRVRLTKSNGHESRVINLVRHLLNLRARGARLPGDTPPSAQALSRLGAPEAADERGLSQVRR